MSASGGPNTAATESPGMPSFNTSQLMGMAALAAAMFNATSETKPPPNVNALNASLSGGSAIMAAAGLQASTSATASRQNANMITPSTITSTTANYQANSSFNKAASLLAQSKSSNVGNNQISFYFS